MTIPFRLTSLLAFLLLLASVPLAQTPTSAPQTPTVPVANNLQLVIEGKVISVHDGDTVTMLDQDNQKHHIRLQGIDAPELKQAFGGASQQNLARMVLGKQVTIVWAKVDRYRRTVGTIMLNGQDINIQQVRGGFAWHFKKYEDEQEPQDRITYAAAEQAARAANLGLWNTEEPTRPGDWRLAVRLKRWGPPPPEGTIIGTKTTMKYHRPDCEGYRNMAEKNRVFFKTVAEAESAGYKRAGNCPAEPVVAATTSPSALTPAQISPVSSLVVIQISEPCTHSEYEEEPRLRTALSLIAEQEPAPVTELATSSLPSVHGAAVSPAVMPSSSTAPSIIGNKNSKLYHLAGCPGYTQVLEKNRVNFATVEEAEKSGYRLAGNCKQQTAESKQ